MEERPFVSNNSTHLISKSPHKKPLYLKDAEEYLKYFHCITSKIVNKNTKLVKSNIAIQKQEQKHCTYKPDISKS